MKLLMVRLTVFALIWQSCQGVKMEEGFEEQFQAETLTLAQCSSAVKKVQEAGKYTEDAILPICSSVVRSSKCDFFSEALSLATSHTDFNAKDFCKNIGEAHFCSQTMDRLLSSPVMSDLAFGECMRDKAHKGEKYCKKFSEFSSYSVQHDDLDTMRACYMMEAYDESDREFAEPNSKKQITDSHEKQGTDSAHETAAPKVQAKETAAPKVQAKKQSTGSVPKASAVAPKVQAKNLPEKQSTSSAHETAAPKPHAVVSKAAQKVQANASSATTHNTATEHKKPAKELSAAESTHHVLSEKASPLAAKNASAKNASVKKDASLKTNASLAAKKAETSKKSDTSLVSSLIHTLSDTVAGVAHAVAKVVAVSHDSSAHNSTSGHGGDLAKKSNATNAPLFGSLVSKGAALTQSQKVGEKQSKHSSGRHGNVEKVVASASHSGHSKVAVSLHHGQSVAAKTTDGKAVIKHGKAALVAGVKPQKVQTKGKVGKEAHEKNEKDEKDKYGGFLSGFVP